MAQQHPRNILAYPDAPTLGQPEALVRGHDGLFDDADNFGEGSAGSSCRTAWTITLPGSGSIPPDRCTARSRGARLFDVQKVR